MVRLTVGVEGTAEEVQLGQPSAIRAQTANTPKKPQRPAHPQAVTNKIPQAIRSYTSWKNADPIKEAISA
jgi:hypothetical protein